MRLYLFSALIFLHPFFSQAAKANNSFKEKYIYNVKYLNLNIGEMSVTIISKPQKKSTFFMKLETKKKLSWIYSLHQTIVATFDTKLLSLREWKNTKKEKSRKTYEHFYLESVKGGMRLSQRDKKKLITKSITLLPKNSIVHTVWTIPWYIASVKIAIGKTQNIWLLYKKKLATAKIKALSKKKTFVLGEKTLVQEFSVSSLGEKDVQLKVQVGLYKKNIVVNNFDLKLKTGQLRATLKSYKKETL